MCCFEHSLFNEQLTFALFLFGDHRNHNLNVNNRHPAFQEDEIELIALGGVLGAIVGVIQLFTLFGE